MQSSIARADLVPFHFKFYREPSYANPSSIAPVMQRVVSNHDLQHISRKSRPLKTQLLVVFLFSLISILCVRQAAAVEVALRDGRKYNVDGIYEVTRAEVKFHENGVVFGFPYADLSPADQAKVVAVTKILKDNYHELRGEFVQVLEEGALFYGTIERYLERDYTNTVVTTRPPVYVEQAGLRNGRNTNKQQVMIRPGSVEKESRVEKSKIVQYRERDATIFVRTQTEKYVDGDKWSGYVYPCGTHSYIAVSGASKKVLAYTTDQHEFLKYYWGKSSN